MSSWDQSKGVPGLERLAVVAVDMDIARMELIADVMTLHRVPDKIVQYFILGRAALLATRACNVISLGGGGVCALEAESSKASGAHWTIFCVSRGTKEAHPSLCD